MLKKISEKIYCLGKTNDIFERIKDLEALSEVQNTFFLIEELNDIGFTLTQFENAYKELNTGISFDSWKEKCCSYNTNVLCNLFIVNKLKLSIQIELSKTEKKYKLLKNNIIRKSVLQNKYEYYSINLNEIVEYIRTNLYE